MATPNKPLHLYNHQRKSKAKLKKTQRPTARPGEFSTGLWLKKFNLERDPAGKPDSDQPAPYRKIFGRRWHFF